jgi:hypothetical protein
MAPAFLALMFPCSSIVYAGGQCVTEDYIEIEGSGRIVEVGYGIISVWSSAILLTN